MTKQDLTTNTILQYFRTYILSNQLQKDHNKFFSESYDMKEGATYYKKEGYIEYFSHLDSEQNVIYVKSYLKDRLLPKLLKEIENARLLFIKQIEELDNTEAKVLFHERFKNELNSLIKLSKNKHSLFSDYESVTNTLLSLFDEIIDYPITSDSNILNNEENLQYKFEWAKDPELFFLLAASLIQSNHLTIYNGKKSQKITASTLFNLFHVTQKNNNKEYTLNSFTQMCKPSNHSYSGTLLGEQKDRITELLKDIMKKIN